MSELILSNTTDLLRVQAQEIMCIKADGNYSQIILDDGEVCLVGFQLGQLEQLIDEQLGDAHGFVRIGRGAIINLLYLFRISLPKQVLSLRSPQGHKEVLQGSKEALRQLKLLMEEHTHKK